MNEILELDISTVIPTLVAGIGLYYTISTKLADSLFFYFRTHTDDTRFKYDLTSLKNKNHNAFTFALFCFSIFLFISIIVTQYTNIHIIIPFLVCTISLIIYVFMFTAKLTSKTLVINHKDKRWYLAGQTDDNKYLFKDSNSKSLSDSKLLLIDQQILVNSFTGYVENNNNKSYNIILKLRDYLQQTLNKE